VRGQAAIADSDRYDALIDVLAEVLAEKYDAVDRRDGQIVAEVTAFDPGLAHDAGVPEGPAFGRLSDGESISVDGRTINPEAVESTRTEEFPI